MSIRIFDGDNWAAVREGIVSGRDLRQLDREKDRFLLAYMLRRAPERYSRAVMRDLGIKRLPEEPDVSDVLREQVMRESDFEVLRRAAFGNGRNEIGRFAFCRLTGYGMQWDDEHPCGLKSGVTRGDIEDLCREMMEKNGPFARDAEVWLDELHGFSDDTLEKWAAGAAEREEPIYPAEAVKELMRPADGAPELSDEELAEKIKGIASAFRVMIKEETGGHVPMRTRRETLGDFGLRALTVMKRLNRNAVTDEIKAVKAFLVMSGAMRPDITEEKIAGIIKNAGV